jgi:hypothetical protein
VSSCGVVPGAGLIGGVVLSGGAMVCVAIEELGLFIEVPTVLCPAMLDGADP